LCSNACQSAYLCEKRKVLLLTLTSSLIEAKTASFTTRVALTFQTIFQINNLLNLQIIGWFSCTKIKKSPNVELIQRLSINLSTKGDFYG